MKDYSIPKPRHHSAVFKKNIICPWAQWCSKCTHLHQKQVGLDNMVRIITYCDLYNYDITEERKVK